MKYKLLLISFLITLSTNSFGQNDFNTFLHKFKVGTYPTTINEPFLNSALTGKQLKKFLKIKIDKNNDSVTYNAGVLFFGLMHTAVFYSLSENIEKSEKTEFYLSTFSNKGEIIDSKMLGSMYRDSDMGQRYVNSGTIEIKTDSASGYISVTNVKYTEFGECCGDADYIEPSKTIEVYSIVNGVIEYVPSKMPDYAVAIKFINEYATFYNENNIYSLGMTLERIKLTTDWINARTDVSDVFKAGVRDYFPDDVIDPYFVDPVLNYGITKPEVKRKEQEYIKFNDPDLRDWSFGSPYFDGLGATLKLKYINQNWVVDGSNKVNLPFPTLIDQLEFDEFIEKFKAVSCPFTMDTLIQNSALNYAEITRYLGLDVDKENFSDTVDYYLRAIYNAEYVIEDDDNYYLIYSHLTRGTKGEYKEVSMSIFYKYGRFRRTKVLGTIYEDHDNDYYYTNDLLIKVNLPYIDVTKTFTKEELGAELHEDSIVTQIVYELDGTLFDVIEKTFTERFKLVKHSLVEYRQGHWESYEFETEDGESITFHKSQNDSFDFSGTFHFPKLKGWKPNQELLNKWFVIKYTEKGTFWGSTFTVNDRTIIKARLDEK